MVASVKKEDMTRVILEKTGNDAIPYKEFLKGQSIVFELELSKHNTTKYWLRCYKCTIVGSLEDHEVTINKEIINISPSIECPACKAHYWIKNSEIC